MVDFHKFLTLFLLATCSLLASGCGDTKASAAKDEKASAGVEPRKVRTAKVESGRVADTVSATGSLLAQDRAVLSVKAPGRLKEMLADLGSKVEQGKVLAQI